MSTAQKSAGKTKPRLGRGLSSLISVSELPVEADMGSSAGSAALAELAEAVMASEATAPPTDGQPLLVSVDAISPNPHQPRRTLNEASIAELAASLKSSGMIQPVIVRKTLTGYELIAGERRWRAARLAGIEQVPAIVRDVDAFTQAQLALVENIQREDLNPIERAQGYQSLMRQLGLTQAELAGRMGEQRSSIANYLRLLDLAESIRQQVRDGSLSMGHAKLLAGVPDPLEQQRLSDMILAQNLSVRNLERMLQNHEETITARKPSAGSAHLDDLEKSLSRQLSMRVQVRASSKGKGRLILHYTSLDQFDDLVRRLGAKVGD